MGASASVYKTNPDDVTIIYDKIVEQRDKAADLSDIPDLETALLEISKFRTICRKIDAEDLDGYKKTLLNATLNGGSGGSGGSLNVTGF